MYIIMSIILYIYWHNFLYMFAFLLVLSVGVRDSVAILTKGSRDRLDISKKRVMGPSYERKGEDFRLLFNVTRLLFKMTRLLLKWLVTFNCDFRLLHTLKKWPLLLFNVTRFFSSNDPDTLRMTSFILKWPSLKKKENFSLKVTGPH